MPYSKMIMSVFVLSCYLNQRHVDTFPLDAKSIVMTFSKKDLFEISKFLDIIDANLDCLVLLTIR